MVLGQVNALATELKQAIENGLTASGVICTDNSPVYGGTDLDEDFEKFFVYSINIDDELEDEIFTLPMIRFHIQTATVEYFLDESAGYLADIAFEIFFDQEHYRVISDEHIDRKALLNWYLEQLEYLLIKVQLESVMDMGTRNPSSINHGRMKAEDAFIYYGTTNLQIEYLREVS